MIKGTPVAQASPLLFSIHPEPGDRSREGLLLFSSCAENDKHQRKRGSLRPSTQVDKPDPPLQEIDIGISTKRLVKPGRIRSGRHQTSYGVSVSHAPLVMRST